MNPHLALAIAITACIALYPPACILACLAFLLIATHNPK